MKRWVGLSVVATTVCVLSWNSWAAQSEPPDDASTRPLTVRSDLGPSSGAATTVTSGSAATLSPLDEFSARFAAANKAYAALDHYTATFVKQQRVKGELLPRETGLFKFMKPYSVYFKWTDGPNAGTQVLYVEGQNEGRLLARPAGLLGIKTFRLEPLSSLAMKDNLHPITQAGIGKTLELLETNRRRATADNRASVRRLSSNTIPQVIGPCYEVVVEADEKSGYYCRRAILTFDPKTNLLVGMRAFGWDKRMMEEYRYLDLKINCGLTARDFDAKNPAYGF